MFGYKNLFKDYQFSWYGQRALDCVGLEQFIDLDAIMCCDFGLDTPLIVQGRNCRVFSVESTSYRRENWTSIHLDSILEQRGAEISAYLQQLSRPHYVIAYSATDSLAKFAKLQKTGLQLVMPDYQMKVWLDNKLQFARILNELNIPSILAYSTGLGSIHFGHIKQQVGLPFVLHLPFGSAGSGTFFIRNQADLERIQSSIGDSEVLISKYIDGISLNINAAVLANQVVTGSVSVQLIGLEGCSIRPEVYCGNDYSITQRLPERIVNEARLCAFRIGTWLSKLGYQGIFGLDFVVDMDKEAVYPVDLNPRFQNSTHLLTQCEIIQGTLPLVILYIAWKSGILVKNDVLNWESSPVTQLKGSQVIVHNLADTAVRVTGELIPGIYSGSSDSTAKKRDGISLLDLPAEDEIVISCAVPRRGTEVVPGAPLFKIFSWQSVFDIDTRQLRPEIRQFCESAYSQLRLQSVVL